MSSSGVRILIAVLGFWLIMRSVNSDASGRTLVDRILGNKASKSPYLTAGVSAPVAPGGVPGALVPSGSGSILKSLFPAGTAIIPQRRDQGRDLKAPAGTPVLAPGNGTVVRNGNDPGGFGVLYPIVHFLTGPWAGEDVYFGHIGSVVTAGQSIKAGQPLGFTQNGHGPFVGNATTPGWTEIGLAPGGNPGPFGQPLPAGL